MDGQGTITFANGDKYVGKFKDDKQTDKELKLLIMEMNTLENGRISLKPNIGKGTYTWANGDKYIEEWKNGFLDGCWKENIQMAKLKKENL